MRSIIAVARKLATSVTFEPGVVEYLDAIAEQEERTRSQVINRIVKEHAQKNGTTLLSEKARANRTAQAS